MNRKRSNAVSHSQNGRNPHKRGTNPHSAPHTPSGTHMPSGSRTKPDPRTPSGTHAKPDSHMLSGSRTKLDPRTPSGSRTKPDSHMPSGTRRNDAAPPAAPGDAPQYVQWYPGHMAKTRRLIAEHLRQVDAVCEILDARIPISSRNPDMDTLTADKPRLVILNRAGQADPAATVRWAAYYRAGGAATLACDSRSGHGISGFLPAVRELLSDKLQAWDEKGQTGRKIRVMVLGIPNVGKSTFINRIAGHRSAKAENRPGVTRGKQWIVAESRLELLDTPGILWPKFDDPMVGEHLAFTGAVRDAVLDTETLACRLTGFLAEKYPAALLNAYRLSELPERAPEENRAAWGYRLLETAGRKRGCLISGGGVDTERMARIVLDEFRSGKLGCFTLEFPPDTDV